MLELDPEFKARLAAAARRIPPDVLAEITAAHEEYGFECSGASEGLACCLDGLDPGEKP